MAWQGWLLADKLMGLAGSRDSGRVVKIVLPGETIRPSTCVSGVAHRAEKRRATAEANRRTPRGSDSACR